MYRDSCLDVGRGLMLYEIQLRVEYRTKEFLYMNTQVKSARSKKPKQIILPKT